MSSVSKYILRVMPVSFYDAHLLTSKMPTLVMAPTRHIHNSEISVSEFRGHDAFGRGAMCDTPELTYI